MSKKPALPELESKGMQWWSTLTTAQRRYFMWPRFEAGHVPSRTIEEFGVTKGVVAGQRTTWHASKGPNHKPPVLRPHSQKETANKILNAKLRSESKLPKPVQAPELPLVAGIIEKIPPTELRRPVTPIHQSAAFPTGKDSDLTPGELLAIASMYK